MLFKHLNFELSKRMIPLFPPNSEKPIKWQSLVQLVTQSASRRASIDNEQTRCRRPSAPAAMQDLRRMLPAYLLQRHSSTSVFVNENFSGRSLIKFIIEEILQKSYCNICFRLQ